MKKSIIIIISLIYTFISYCQTVENPQILNCSKMFLMEFNSADEKWSTTGDLSFDPYPMVILLFKDRIKIKDKRETTVFIKHVLDETNNQKEIKSVYDCFDQLDKDCKVTFTNKVEDTYFTMDVLYKDHAMTYIFLKNNQ